MRAVDQRGAPVTDLDRSEVEVFEEGRRQEITAFQRVSIPIATSVEPPATNPGFTPPDVVSNRVTTASRIFVMVLDDLHVDRRNTAHVKEAARASSSDTSSPTIWSPSFTRECAPTRRRTSPRIAV